MVCRIKVKIRTDDKEVEGKALLSSGFESDSPDIVVPVDVAEALGLWPREQAKQQLWTQAEERSSTPTTSH
ncbi:MAG: hypothetical protein ACP5KE_09270 [Candidatus Methanodesulfokora sp.]